MSETVRKIEKSLMAKFLSGGEYETLLDYINKHKAKLRLEIRRKNEAIVYYKKNKILKIGLKSLFRDPKYAELKNTSKQQVQVDTQILPEAKIAIKYPDAYFKNMEKCIDNWLKINSKNEFAAQQNIAYQNSDDSSEYIIIDMEYSPCQQSVDIKNRVYKKDENGKRMIYEKGKRNSKSPIFDLLGIERKTGNIIIFELKKGIKSLDGNSGVEDHIEDFEDFFVNSKKIFKEILKKDIDGIIESKKKLGLLKLPDNFCINYDNIQFMFIFDPEKEEDENYYKKKVKLLAEKYPTIFVRSDSYKLILSKK
ncbi:MAG: hypothetical protein FWC26_08955 [Fibromonadales bacterium]|nr:hypothetical protein [Fibromonadales bacterium]